MAGPASLRFEVPREVDIEIKNPNNECILIVVWRMSAGSWPLLFSWRHRNVKNSALQAPLRRYWVRWRSGGVRVWDWVFRCSSTNDQKMKLFRLCGTCVCFSDLSPEFRFEFDLNSLFMSRGTTNGPIDMGQRSWVPLGKPPPEMPLLMEHLMWKGSMLS